MTVFVNLSEVRGSLVYSIQDDNRCKNVIFLTPCLTNSLNGSQCDDHLPSTFGSTRPKTQTWWSVWVFPDGTWRESFLIPISYVPCCSNRREALGCQINTSVRLFGICLWIWLGPNSLPSIVMDRAVDLRLQVHPRLLPLCLTPHVRRSFPSVKVFRGPTFL